MECGGVIWFDVGPLSPCWSQTPKPENPTCCPENPGVANKPFGRDSRTHCGKQDPSNFAEIHPQSPHSEKGAFDLIIYTYKNAVPNNQRRSELPKSDRLFCSLPLVCEHVFSVRDRRHDLRQRQLRAVNTRSDRCHELGVCGMHVSSILCVRRRCTGVQMCAACARASHACITYTHACIDACT